MLLDDASADTDSTADGSAAAGAASEAALVQPTAVARAATDTHTARSTAACFLFFTFLPFLPFLNLEATASLNSDSKEDGTMEAIYIN